MEVVVLEAEERGRKGERQWSVSEESGRTTVPSYPRDCGEEMNQYGR